MHLKDFGAGTWEISEEENKKKKLFRVCNISEMMIRQHFKQITNMCPAPLKSAISFHKMAISSRFASQNCTTSNKKTGIQKPYEIKSNPTLPLSNLK